MNFSNPEEVWLLLAGVAMVAFFLGRQSATSGGDEGAAAMRRMQDQGGGETVFSTLSPTARRRSTACLKGSGHRGDQADPRRNGPRPACGETGGRQSPARPAGRAYPLGKVAGAAVANREGEPPS